MVFMELSIKFLESAQSLVSRSRPACVKFKADAALTDSTWGPGHHKVQYTQIPVRTVHNGLTESGAKFLTYLFVLLFLRQGLLGGPGWPGTFHIYRVSASRLPRLVIHHHGQQWGMASRRACSVSGCVRRCRETDGSLTWVGITWPSEWCLYDATNFLAQQGPQLLCFICEKSRSLGSENLKDFS